MKKLSRMILPVFLSLIGIISGAGGVWGLYSETVSVKNHVETGDVKIRIEEYEQKDGKLQAFTNHQTVLPGDVISKIVQIKNLASPSWVRCKVTFGKGEGNSNQLEMKDLSGISEKWVRQGDYYYYKEPLEKQSFAEFFTQVHIPEAWDSEAADQTLSINIRADAIQKEGFQPDFKALSPWGNQEIQECIHEEDNRTIQVKKNIKPSVVFSGDAHRLVAAPDDFFGNLPELMPGSEYSDQVLLDNQGKTSAELFFGTGLEDPAKEEKDLLEHLFLSIEYKGKILYHGPLSSEELSEMVSLGTFDPGEKGEMKFTVSMPKELDNAYARRAADVKWLFSVKCEESSAGGGYSSNKGYVKTGDYSDTQIYILLLMLSVSCFCFAAFLKRRPENETK